MARPWGGNYAYQDASGYLVLGGFLLFSVSPLAGLAMLSRLFLRSTVSQATFVAGACGIGIVGSLAYCNAAFVHVDAQGGLVFLSMPLLQWLGTLVLLAVCGLIVRLSRPAAA